MLVEPTDPTLRSEKARHKKGWIRGFAQALVCFSGFSVPVVSIPVIPPNLVARFFSSWFRLDFSPAPLPSWLSAVSVLQDAALLPFPRCRRSSPRLPRLSLPARLPLRPPAPQPSLPPHRPPPRHSLLSPSPYASPTQIAAARRLSATPKPTPASLPIRAPRPALLMPTARHPSRSAIMAFVAFSVSPMPIAALGMKPTISSVTLKQVSASVSIRSVYEFNTGP